MEFTIDELLAHDGLMMLLEQVVSFDNRSMICQVVVRDDGLFGGNGQELPAWVGIEYMAQTIAAHTSMMDKLAGQPSHFGYLLGTRGYTTNVPGFRVGETLSVRVEKIIEEQGLGVYRCQIIGTGVLAEANINVYQPDSKKNRAIVE